MNGKEAVNGCSFFMQYLSINFSSTGSIAFFAQDPLASGRAVPDQFKEIVSTQIK